MKIREIKYDAHGTIKYAYFKANTIEDFNTSKFYENWLDCRDETDNYIKGFDDIKLRESIETYIKLKKYGI